MKSKIYHEKNETLEKHNFQYKCLFISSLTTDSGVSVRAWNMARVVSKAMFEVYFLERNPKEIKSKQHNEIISLKISEHNNLFISIIKATLIGLWLTISKKWDILYAFKPLPNSVLPALAARAMGARIILDIDDLDYEYYNKGFKRWVTKIFFNTFPRLFHGVSYHNENLGKYLVEKCKVKPQRLFKIPQGVDMYTFTPPFPEIDKEATKFLSTHQSIAYMASLGITSDFEDIIPMLGKIIKTFPGCGVLVMGHGVKLDLFYKIVQDEGIENYFYFTGYIPHEKVPAYLSRCTAGLHYLRPGGANEYRAIMKIREYLAIKLPTIANPSADCEEFKDFIYICRDEKDYFSAMENILSGKAQQRTEQGFNYVSSQLDWDRLAPEILKIITPGEEC